VMEILFNMAAKNKIGGLYGFEGLLKYYVKLTPTQFIEQWVTPELYIELLLELFSSQMIPLNGDKDHLDFQCVYYGREWHRFKGCPNASIDPRTNKHICIPMLPNLATTQLSKVLK